MMGGLYLIHQTSQQPAAGIIRSVIPRTCCQTSCLPTGPLVKCPWAMCHVVLVPLRRPRATRLQANDHRISRFTPVVRSALSGFTAITEPGLSGALAQDGQARNQGSRTREISPKAVSRRLPSLGVPGPRSSAVRLLGSIVCAFPPLASHHRWGEADEGAARGGIDVPFRAAGLS